MARTIKIIAFFVTCLLVAGCLVVFGINSRIRAAAVVKQETLDQSIPSVAVIRPKRGAMKDEIVLPGNIQAFVDAPIYARTSGYLKKWYTDIGTRVKAGELIAEIESPEVDQQLAQAKAELATANANMKLAELTMNRDQNLLKLEAIAKQDVDNAVGAYEADKAIVESQGANLKRLEQLVAFEKVTAPFDGVITARNTDIGALINAGNGGATQELFRMATTDKLRVFISVPQTHSRAAIPGVNAELTLTEFPGRHFTGKIARNAGSIDPSTRTLLTEVDIDNTNGALLPGAYAEVHLRLPDQTPALMLPVTALIFRAEGLRVALVRDGKADLVTVTLGRDFGTTVEVTSGITEHDQVIVSPPDSLSAGSPVRAESKPES
jgi:RND family efflux transporter MFP subunit